MPAAPIRYGQLPSESLHKTMPSPVSIRFLPRATVGLPKRSSKACSKTTLSQSHFRLRRFSSSFTFRVASFELLVPPPIVKYEVKINLKSRQKATGFGNRCANLGGRLKLWRKTPKGCSSRWSFGERDGRVGRDGQFPKRCGGSTISGDLREQKSIGAMAGKRDHCPDLHVPERIVPPNSFPFHLFHTAEFKFESDDQRRENMSPLTRSNVYTKSMQSCNRN